MSNPYKAVAAILGQAITSINAILTGPEDEMHRIRVTNNLQREADQLLLLTGTGDLATGESTVLGPAKTIGGKAIKQQRRFTEADLVPADDKVLKLKQDVNDALVYFGPDASAEGILANVPDLIIRGVAKKAGLKVSKDEPKELTVEFIEEVKEALVDAGLTQHKVPAPALTDEENEYLNQKFVIAGGTAEIHNAPDVVGAPMGADKIEAVIEEQPSKQAEMEQPVIEVHPAPASEQPKDEEPKQETKPDTKKKAGK